MIAEYHCHCLLYEVIAFHLKLFMFEEFKKNGILKCY